MHIPSFSDTGDSILFLSPNAVCSSIGVLTYFIMGQIFKVIQYTIHQFIIVACSQDII